MQKKVYKWLDKGLITKDEALNLLADIKKNDKGFFVNFLISVFKFIVIFCLTAMAYTFIISITSGTINISNKLFKPNHLIDSCILTVVYLAMIVAFIFASDYLAKKLGNKLVTIILNIFLFFYIVMTGLLLLLSQINESSAVIIILTVGYLLLPILLLSSVFYILRKDKNENINHCEK